MINKDNYIELKMFALTYDLKEKTIEKRFKDLPIMKKEEDGYYILKGTKYQFSMRGYKKPLDKNDSKIIILKAISQCRYIDYVMLGIDNEKFELYISELMEKEYIYYNNKSLNKYGTNPYELTEQGEKYLSNLKYTKKCKNTLLAAEAVGTIIGKVIEETKKVN